MPDAAEPVGRLAVGLVVVAAAAAAAAAAAVVALAVELGLVLGAELRQRLADPARPVSEVEPWLEFGALADLGWSRLDWPLAASGFAHPLLGEIVRVGAVCAVAELVDELVGHVGFELVAEQLVGVVAGLVDAAAGEL